MNLKLIINKFLVWYDLIFVEFIFRGLVRRIWRYKKFVDAIFGGGRWRKFGNAKFGLFIYKNCLLDFLMVKSKLTEAYTVMQKERELMGNKITLN